MNIKELIKECKREIEIFGRPSANSSKALLVVVEKLSKALGFYADENNWKLIAPPNQERTFIDDDKGEIAKQVLHGKKKNCKWKWDNDGKHWHTQCVNYFDKYSRSCPDCGGRVKILDHQEFWGKDIK